MVVIYRPAPGWPATQTVLLLQQNGFTPNVSGSGLAENMTLPSAGGSATVEISVPDDQAGPAREFLQRWDNYKQIAVKRHANTYRMHLIISLAVGVTLGGAAAWIIAGFVLPGIGQFLTATILFVAITLVLLGHFTRAPEPRDEFGLRCPKCDYSLVGLTILRCPECGTQFDESVLADAPARD